MKIGIALTTSVSPAVTAEAQADYVTRLAAAAEQGGFDSVWVSDRTVYPQDLAARYPEMFGPGQAAPEGQNVLEAITTLSYVAGCTRRVRLGISVLVLPFRHPILNTKMLTTLDQLSGGRLIAGVGVGWMPEEFAAMGAAHTRRGAVTDQQITLFKALCGEAAPPAQTGAGMVFFPRPVQRPHPPIWVGGNSEAALRRAARLGDAWHGIRLAPAQIPAQRAALARLCAAYGRAPHEVQITLRATLELEQERRDGQGERLPLTGSVPQIRQDLAHYREAGLDYLVLSVAAPDTARTLQAVHRFAQELLPYAAAPG